VASVSNEEFVYHETRRDSDHESFLKHRGMRWLKVAIVVSLVAVLGYVFADVKPRPNGGSWYGYTLGTVGAGLIVWLALLGIRKRAMTAGRWSLKAWTSAHVYLGLALIVIVTLHTGFQLGWNVHTLAYALMLLVIVSGVYGIVVYHNLPRELSTNRRAMTRTQMVEAMTAIDRQLETAAQPLARVESDLVIDALHHDVFTAGLLKRLKGFDRTCATHHAMSVLAHRSGDPAIDRVTALLRRRSGQLEQIRRQMRLKALLEVWLYIHIPATIALLAALTAHIVSVFYYW
jgi:hypothetical protein